ncbi:MAG: putative acetyl xylan esterase [Clostridia bacterium]|nr:putative acetyl xylan esterase [Clostridia bacterium]
MLPEKLNQLNLPQLLINNNRQSVNNSDDWKSRRAEIKDVLIENVYGKMPLPPEKVIGKQVDFNSNAFAGKATQAKIMISFQTPKGMFEFPVILIKPKKVNRPLLILHIAFLSADISNNYYPAEEIIDNGFAVASFCYNDITADKDDSFSSGLAAMYHNDNRKSDEWGKIAMWAWAASRVMDYLQDLDDNEIDKNNIAVMGHSRLGKTALLAGAMDERFAFTISNDSGCSGAAITRGKTGEHIKDICKNFGYWFCENYKKYIDNEENMPFDQHFLLALTAPRFLYIASASEDSWADSYSEFLSCVEVDKVFRLLNYKGFSHPDRYPEADESFTDGNIGYHLRNGTHFLSRYDWQKFINFINKHRI